jgi:hypothetical protein
MEKTKIFCDVCNAEITDDHYYIVSNNPGPSMGKRKDCCPKCTPIKIR